MRVDRVGMVVGAAFLLVLGCVSSCQLLVGIEDDHFRVVPSAPKIPDPCARAVPPPRPDAGDSDSKFGPLVFALREIELSTEGEAEPGFDLDGVCTCDGRKGTAHDGASSCTPPPDAG